MEITFVPQASATLVAAATEAKRAFRAGMSVITPMMVDDWEGYRNIFLK